jgi:type IV fimbrial biogenesis protein FimU
MRERNKGFTLMELVVTVSVSAILAGVAMPAFITMITKGRADTEVGDFYRALNFARLEAINRGVNVQILPDNKSSAGWNTLLKVQAGTTLIRVVPGMSPNAILQPSSAVSYIEFNNLGTLNYPTTALTMTYTNGSITRTVGICLNGRVVPNGPCA